MGDIHILQDITMWQQSVALIHYYSYFKKSQHSTRTALYYELKTLLYCTFIKHLNNFLNKWIIVGVFEPKTIKCFPICKWRLSTVMRKDHCRISTQMQLEVDYSNKLMFVNVNFSCSLNIALAVIWKVDLLYVNFFFHGQSEKSCHSSECLLNVCKLFSHKFWSL